MSAPVVWILIPEAIAALAYLFRRWQRITQAVGVFLALVLAWLAYQLPIGGSVTLWFWPGRLVWEISDRMTIFGRLFVLSRASEPTLILVYLSLAVWLEGAFAARSTRLFLPIGYAIAGLVTASIAVEPTLYAALFIELVALLCVPVLSPPGTPLNPGALRFLAFQTLGMGLVLLGDWMISTLEVNPNNASLFLHSSLLLGLGFAFLLGIFPFHTWMTMLTDQADLFATAFIYFMIPTAISILGLDYLDRFNRIGASPSIYAALRLGGALAVVSGGSLAALERHLGRILGFTALVQIGIGLLALSLGDEPGTGSALIGIFFAQRLPIGFGLAIWALALSILREHVPDLSFHAVKGYAATLPVATASVVLANFSLAGLPLLASFPPHIALWYSLAHRFISIVLLTLAGNACLFIAGLRTLAVFVSNSGISPKREFSERRTPVALLVGGWLILLLIGLTPQWFFPYLFSMAHIFVNPIP
jgi:formate hydrogenlyase subunit 3/multisubunit Na+/H+ antiporter MnhD subunit